MIQLLMNYIIFNITRFDQELKGGNMNDQAGQLIQQYSINLLSQKLLIAKDVFIFHYQRN